MPDNDRIIEGLQAEVEQLRREKTALTRERDRYKQQFTELQRKVEAQRITNDALGGGMTSVVQTLQGQIERLIAERDEARGAIQRNHEIALRAAMQQREQFEKYGGIVEQVSEEHSVPQITWLLLGAGQLLTQIAEEVWNHKMAQLPPHPEIYDYLLQTRNLSRIEGILWASEAAALRSLGFSQDPHIVSDEILRECRTGDRQPSLKTLHRLTSEFLTTLPDPPSKHETLQLGLTEAQRRLDGESINLTDRRLRTYMGWYEHLEGLALQKPEFLREAEENSSDSLPPS